MKRIILLFIIAFTALFLGSLHSMAQTKCSHCNNGYVRPFPKVSGYGTRESKKKCPNCGQWVYSGHVCKCRFCGGTGRIGGSSYKSRSSNKSSIYKVKPIPDYDPAQKLLNTARFHQNGKETVTFQEITETRGTHRQWLNINTYPNSFYPVNSFDITCKANIKGCNNVVVMAVALVYNMDGTPARPIDNLGPNEIYARAMAAGGGTLNQVSPSSNMIHLAYNDANVTFRLFLPTDAIKRPGPNSRYSSKYKIEVTTTDNNKYYSGWRYFDVTWN